MWETIVSCRREIQLKQISLQIIRTRRRKEKVNILEYTDNDNEEEFIQLPYGIVPNENGVDELKD